MKVGVVRELVRYPVKSMAGVPMESAFLGSNGIDGDRRFAFRRLANDGGYPWLTASRFPGLLLYHPLDEQVCTPSGAQVDLRGAELQDEISARSGDAVELRMVEEGIFDEGAISIISLTTIGAIGREAGLDLDPRRMRANVLLDTDDSTPFLEDAWVGATLTFGEAAVKITARDLRCVMVNLDPDTAASDPRVMKAAVRLHDNYAGVYGTVVRSGWVRVGEDVRVE